MPESEDLRKAASDLARALDSECPDRIRAARAAYREAKEAAESICAPGSASVRNAGANAVE